MNTLTEKLALRDRFRDLLQETAKHRDKRQRIVTDGDYRHTIEWVLHERMTMWEAVNLARAARGLVPVARNIIDRADQVAMGTDWCDKFALYCAEIVLGEH